MAKRKTDVSDQSRFNFSTKSKKKAPEIEFSTAMKTFSLTSTQLEQWFATIERGHKQSKETNPHLSALFLSHFGLQHPIQVIEFIKSPEGKVTLTLISQELMKIESLNQYQADMYQKEALMRERRLTFLLMALIAKDKAHAKHVSELIQNQIDEKLKRTKQNKNEPNQKAIAIQILDENILAYTNAIKAVDAQLNDLNQYLSDVDKELAIIEEDGIQMAERHDILFDYITHLNNTLHLVKFHEMPMDLYFAHTNQQILSLTTQLAELKAEHAKYAIIHSAVSRKIRMMEEQLAFYQDQLNQPPQNIEHVFQLLLELNKARLEEHQNQTQVPYHEHEMEGLRLRQQGLHQALQVVRKEKALLNEQLKEVHDFEEAHFIIETSHKTRYRKLGDSYAFCPDDKDPIDMSEEDWVEAQANYQQLKSDIHVVNVQCQQQMQQQIEVHAVRKQQQVEVRDQFLSQMDELKASKVQLLHALSSTKAQKALLLQASKDKTKEPIKDVVDPEDPDSTLGFFKTKSAK